MRFYIVLPVLAVYTGCGSETTTPVTKKTNNLRSDDGQTNGITVLDTDTTRGSKPIVDTPTKPVVDEPVVDVAAEKYFAQYSKVFFNVMAGPAREDSTPLLAHPDMQFKPTMTLDKFVEMGTSAVIAAMSDRSNFPAGADSLFDQCKNPTQMILQTLKNHLKAQYTKLTK